MRRPLPGNAGEGIGQRTRDCHSRICERGRGREPVRRGNVQADRIGHRRWRPCDATEDRQQQAESRDAFRKPLPRSRSHCGGKLPERQLEHEVRGPHASDCAKYLGSDIKDQRQLRQLAPQGEGDRHSRIEVCAGDWPEGEDQLPIKPPFPPSLRPVPPPPNDPPPPPSPLPFFSPHSTPPHPASNSLQLGIGRRWCAPK